MTELILEAGAGAFGDANHPTTGLLLGALDGLATQIAPRSICDMGCGSGILSLRAAQLWPEAHITAADLERSAVEATRRNAQANGIKIAAQRILHHTLTPSLSLNEGEGALNPRPQRGRGQGEGEWEISRLLTFARELRLNATDAEATLWKLIRNRQCLGFKFRRQHRVLGYIADFACTECKHIIELDGGQHNTLEGQENDKKRTGIFEAHGWTITRFWNHDVLMQTEAVMESLYHTLTLTLSLDEGEGIHTVHSDGFDHPDIQAAAPYDLILMNILAEPILRLLADAYALLEEEGLLLLSGMLAWQQEPIIEASQSLGLELSHRFQHGEWVAHLWQKS